MARKHPIYPVPVREMKRVSRKQGPGKAGKDLDKTEQRETRSASSKEQKVQRWRHDPVNRKMNCDVSQTRFSSESSPRAKVSCRKQPSKKVKSHRMDSIK